MPITRFSIMFDCLYCALLNDLPRSELEALGYRDLNRTLCEVQCEQETPNSSIRLLLDS